MPISNDVFVCLDCETTGLNPKIDRIIEVAAIIFTFAKTIDSFETLVNPDCIIPESSIEIHHITQEMVQGKPKIEAVLASIIPFINNHIIVGHGIKLDLLFLEEEAKRCQIPFSADDFVTIDTLRLARLYGESSINSLEKLREHFNIEPQTAHRAKSDVVVNIAVFKHLARSFITTKQILERLKKPILLKAMPLGRYKGSRFKEIPVDELRWLSRGNFDQDLLFSIRTELQKRGKGGGFLEASNPFAQL
jgi:DNA polymerase III subunit epsilon